MICHFSDSSTPRPGRSRAARPEPPVRSACRPRSHRSPPRASTAVWRGRRSRAGPPARPAASPPPVGVTTPVLPTSTAPATDAVPSLPPPATISLPEAATVIQESPTPPAPNETSSPCLSSEERFQTAKVRLSSFKDSKIQNSLKLLWPYG